MPPEKKKKIEIGGVAKTAKVSLPVVYSFLNGKYYGNDSKSRIGISEATGLRIQQACRKLGYEPNSAAAKVRVYPERGGFILLLATTVGNGISNPYFSAIFQGASQALAGSQRQIGFSSFDPSIDYLQNAELLPGDIRAGVVNKVILCGDVNYSLIISLQNHGCQVAYASRDVPLDGVIGVVPDYRDAVLQAMNHLKKLGHKQVALAADYHAKSDAYFSVELMAGFEAAAKKIAFPQDDFSLVKGDLDPAIQERFLDRVLESRLNTKAIFCFDDYTAIVLTNYALRRGIRVPEDLSIIGCNDDNWSVAPIPLTSVYIPKIEIGQRAVALLDARFEGECNKGERITETLPVHLVIRDTAGPAS